MARVKLLLLKIVKKGSNWIGGLSTTKILTKIDHGKFAFVLYIRNCTPTITGSHASGKMGHTREIHKAFQGPGNTLEFQKICGKPGKLAFQHFIPSIAKSQTIQLLCSSFCTTRPCWFPKVGKIYCCIAPYDLRWAVRTACILKPNTSKLTKKWFHACCVTLLLVPKHIPLLTICDTWESFSGTVCTRECTGESSLFSNRHIF